MEIKEQLLVLKLPFKTLQGRGRGIKSLAFFASGLYHTATTLPVI